ncbi:hypothetical protein HCH_02882 [Hahella chejuensis KCTC 2396]|uniref:Uncharacterized protein n=1 Tax=Hahella chejuensis (strain KCTC 2396) TaxID=349521 RepID=Q2SI67_HAHCH|nr:hypothetical protein HCH_02882 [Hahella chejuensis KCTC 2396]
MYMFLLQLITAPQVPQALHAHVKEKYFLNFP